MITGKQGTNLPQVVSAADNTITLNLPFRQICMFNDNCNGSSMKGRACVKYLCAVRSKRGVFSMQYQKNKWRVARGSEMLTCSTATKGMARREMSGWVASVDATLLNSMQGMNTLKATCHQV